MKNVLLYLGKFPGYGSDIDGGSILAKQLIDSLKIKCNLNVVFIRKNGETYEDNLVNSIRYVEYKNATDNKFKRRLANLDTNRKAIGDYYQYDIIITAHVSKFFGFEALETDFWKRTILFPMFCTSSYIKAGEIVPQLYTSLEKVVIQNVFKIITPSMQEKIDLLNDYNCTESKIFVINRGVSPLFKFKKRRYFDSIIKIVYIASIKPQKNNIDALKLLRILNRSDLKFEMNFVCTIQDVFLYNYMLKYIQTNNLSDYVKFHIGLSQKELSLLLQNMDINISVSNWETFGRGIYEGITAGLPTFIFNHLKVIKELCDSNLGVSYSNTINEMSEEIIKTCKNIDKYLEKSDALITLAEKVSYEKEQQLLVESILNENNI